VACVGYFEHMDRVKAEERLAAKRALADKEDISDVVNE